MENKITDKLLPKSITTLDDVKDFAIYLIVKESVMFHPDENFNVYININNNEQSFTKEQADKRNDLMEQCFSVCEKENVDIYSFMSNCAFN